MAEGLSVRTVEEIVSLGIDDTPRAGGPLRRPPPVAPGLLRLANRLSDLYETRVKVEQGRHKGKIIIEYATIEDLERIVKVMNPAASGRGGCGVAGSTGAVPGDCRSRPGRPGEPD